MREKRLHFDDGIPSYPLNHVVEWPESKNG